MRLSFDKTKMGPLRALLAITIVLGHFPYYGVEELSPLSFLAPLAVSMFLFISGYGLSWSYEKKGDAYLDGFLKRRGLHIVIPALIVYALHLLLCGNGDMSLTGRMTAIIRHGDTLLPHYWFVWVILLLYLAFYVCKKYERGSRADFDILVLSSFLALLLAIAGFDRCWWVSILSFPAGIYFARHEDRICAYCGKNNVQFWLCEALLLAVSMLLIASGHGLGRALGFAVFSFFAALLIARIPTSEYRPEAVDFTGRVSYEIYLVHITVMMSLRGRGLSIGNNAWYVFAVFVTTFLAAWLLNEGCGRINKLIK